MSRVRELMSVVLHALGMTKRMLVLACNQQC